MVPRTSRPSLSVKVLSASGRPVISAELLVSTSLERTLAPDDLRLLGVTDSSGMFTLSQESEATPPAAICVRAPGLASSFVDRPKWRFHYDVTLGPGLALVGRVQDERGAPIPGAVLSVSRSPIDPAGGFRTARRVPGLIAAEAVHCSESDENGVVEILDLESGSYDFTLWHPSHVFMDSGEFPRGSLELPSSSTTFAMERLVGVRKRIRGMDVLASAYVGAITNGHWSRDFFAFVREELEGGDEPSVCFLSGASSCRLTERSVALFLRGEGWREFTFPVEPIDIRSEPGVLELEPSTRAGSSPAAALIEIALRGVDGTLFAIEEVGLVSTSGRDFVIHMANGGSAEIPSGAYKITTGEPLLDEHYADLRIAARAGETVTLDRSHGLVACSLHLYRGDRRPVVGRVGLIVEPDGQPRSIRSVWHGQTLLLPPGRIGLEVVTTEGSYLRSIVVTESEPGVPHRVEVQLP